MALPMYPLAETLVAHLDPITGLHVPVKATTLTSLTSAVWQNPAAFGPLFTAIASPAIPEAQALTRSTWALVTERPGDRYADIAMLSNAAKRYVRPYRGRFHNDDAALELATWTAVTSLTQRWSHVWTAAEAFDRLHKGFGWIGQRIGREVRDASGGRKKGWPDGTPCPYCWDGALNDRICDRCGVAVPAGAQGPWQQFGGSPAPEEDPLDQPGARFNYELLIEFLRRRANAVTSGYIELKRREPDATQKEACDRLGLTPPTLRRHLALLWQEMKRLGIV